MASSSGPDELKAMMGGSAAELSEELASQLSSGGGNNALVLPARNASKRKSRQQPQAALPMSKSKRKKLEKLKQRKEKEAQRKMLYKSLQRHVLPDAHMALLSSSKSIGQRATLRERLRHDLRRERFAAVARAILPPEVCKGNSTR